MTLLVLVLVVAASAVPEGYNLPTPTGPSLTPVSCSNGQIRHVDGRCVTPQVHTRAFVYDVPPNEANVDKPQYIPEPKVEQNIIFVRLPEGAGGPEPIVIPPPRQQHVVYVLNKQSEQDQRVIEVPAPPQSNPEVFFVNYAEGENPTLPSGVDLETALSSASHDVGSVVGDIRIGGGIRSDNVEGVDDNLGNDIKNSTRSGIVNLANFLENTRDGIGNGTEDYTDDYFGNNSRDYVGSGFGDDSGGNSGV